MEGASTAAPVSRREEPASRSPSPPEAQPPVTQASAASTATLRWEATGRVIDGIALES
jgi:hypothetical protein